MLALKKNYTVEIMFVRFRKLLLIFKNYSYNSKNHKVSKMFVGYKNVCMVQNKGLQGLNIVHEIQKMFLQFKKSVRF